ncbi:dihydrofolate reductase family protein [Nitratireductor sp. ZSWI3]|uniref:dihydrofolate reductase family protein n=1 Tax=Nitratireductor sp. ZSWI3 TaxID=2966359 RepID=UPI00214F9A76|nr:dihydrofolate reductase family protein [Nitratireductor sp. ZSWI3]MCR4268516.1 dihydrofolate reductase family protein [Nitratireductor sp. ZSWI3]
MPAKIVATQYISLDGVIEDPVGMEDTGLGDWTGDYSRGPQGDAFKERELFEASALILGRRTYDGFAAVWPSVTSAYADRINAMPKYLASRSIARPDWNNTRLLAGDLAQEVADLREQLSGTILIFGSASVCHALFSAGLIDELSLLLYPVVLGRGKRLFPDGPEGSFALLQAIPFNDGLLMLRYARKA